MKILYVLLLASAVSNCRSENSSTKDKIPEGCEDPAAYSVHSDRKSKFAGLVAAMNAAAPRIPMQSGESVRSDDILGIDVHHASDVYVAIHAHFSRADRTTFIEVQSDAIDACYFGLSYGEYIFTDEQMNLLDSALNQTTRVEAKAAPCPGSRRGSNDDLVTLYYKDSTFATYLVQRPGACHFPGEESIPLISEDFFRKQYEIRSTITDASSPYPG